MTIREATLALALVGLATATAAQGPAKELSRLSWLEGRWTGTKDGIEMEEHWTSPSGGALLGMHKDVKDGRMVLFEFLRIEATPEHRIVYLASPRGAPVTPFRMVEIADARVVFENPDHDFPQRILYWLDSTGALHARIEGSTGGRLVGEEWVWSKVR